MNLNKIVKAFFAVCVVSAGLFIGSVSAFAAGTGKATDTGVNIRESASTSAKSIGSTTKDVKFDIHSKTTDSAGNVWYKITVTGDTKGYIRSDYVTDVQGDIPSEDGGASTETATTTETTSTATTTEVNPSSYTFGTTTGEVSVRETPSTKANKVATTATNQDVAITGETTGVDGMVWYQINYGDIKGYIRSDLITPGTTEVVDTEAGEDEEIVDETAEETSAPVQAEELEYEIRKEQNDQGEMVYYLYDHNKGTRQSLDNIFAVMEQSQNMTTSGKEKSSGLKIVVVILAVIIAILVAAVAVLGFKLKDTYEEWEDDDEDDDDDDDDDNVPSSGGPLGMDDDEELDEDDIKIVSKRGKPKKATFASRASRGDEPKGDSWKSNKFFEIDDDVEFEFLDIDQ